jgi:multidrug efflux system membrane fusion protein
MERGRLTALYAGALLLLAACSSGGDAGSASGQRPAVPVRVAAAVRKEAPIEVRAIGNVQAYASVAVKPQIEGRLERVHFTEGQEVKKGDLLVVIDPRPFEAAVREAEAKVAQDRAQAEHAAVEARRFGSLIASGVVSQDEHDRARTQAAAFAAAAKADEAALESARIQLQYCHIHSPLDGRVGEVLVDEGNVVKANETTLAIINQVRPVYVEFSVPQQELARIRHHQGDSHLPVVAQPSGNGTEPARGTLTFVNNAVDTNTGTVLLKAAFPNEDERLWPGQFLNVTLTLATRADTLMIPGRAVQSGQDGKYVFVVRDDGTVEPRTVTLGNAVGEEVVVEDGLVAGERVVTDGQLRLAPGMAVDIKDAAA